MWLRGLVSCVSLALVASCASAPDARPSDRPDVGWVGGTSNDALAAPTTAAVPSPPPVPLEACGSDAAGFDGWLVSFRRHAIAEKLSERTVGRALADIAYDREVVELDRSQEAFKLTFEQFAAKHVTRGRIARGRELVRAKTALLAKIRARFGVAPEVLVAIWGLETDFGDNAGARSSLRCLATLAWDCRRSARFRDELLSALRIVERGDLAPEAMVGAWAGELGQTQFLPSSYERFAIDFDGDGRADLVGSAADALASTANYLVEHGWQKDGPYREGTPNFTALRTWNKSELYTKTVVLFASKLARK